MSWRSPFRTSTNKDHTFAVDELNILMLAAAGQTVRATVSIHRRNAGRFSFYCSIPGHREGGIEGTIEVRR